MTAPSKHHWPRDVVQSRPRPGIDQTRARTPDEEGKVDVDGVGIAYEVYGDGDPTVLFMPTWSLVHSRVWKAQIPYLSRHARVVAYDARGNGRSDRPTAVEEHTDERYVADAVAVLDATGTEQAIVVTQSKGAPQALLLAADHPERVAGVVVLGPALSLTRRGALMRLVARVLFERRLRRYPSWQSKFNAPYWQTDYRDFAESYVRAVFGEPHSTKQIEDAVGWALETDAEVIVPTFRAGFLRFGRRRARKLIRRVTCPVLVIVGEHDRVTPPAGAAELARLAGGTLEVVTGSGHAPNVRNPVPVNLAIREFADPGFHRYALPDMTPSSSPRVLYLSSPIGLGHARRDLAIVQALRERVSGVDVDWLTQDPVTRMLSDAGERLHPASAFLASESGHIDREAHEHDLHVFQAWRRMDEIMINNFMVLRDVVRERHYDLIVGDESWELDYYLHENPEEKTTAFAWLTDFVGWLPMPSGGEHERFLAADYNAQMIEHIAQHPQVRDLALFVGAPDDLLADPLGPGLPSIREWTETNYDFTGYVTGFDPAGLGDRDELRAELGYRPGEMVCIVTVGGSGVGASLLRRVIDAYPQAQRHIAGLRMVVVAGPRIDPGSLPQPDGVEVHGYVPDLHRHLAACDIAIVQGGLTTTMELVAGRRPFLYFPLENHFEQQFHVPHRLDRHRAGRRMDITTASPDAIAEALREELAHEVDYLPVAGDGADRAARALAELL